MCSPGLSSAFTRSVNGTGENQAEVRIYRLTLPRYAKTALSGEGPLRVGGRWTPAGLPAVYASASISLALLEILVHAPSPVTPVHHVVTIEVPDSMPVTRVTEPDLPGDWRLTPAPPTLQAIGQAWIEARETAILAVPSAIVPPERNFVLNPLHPDFSRLAASPAEPFEIDRRLFG